MASATAAETGMLNEDGDGDDEGAGGEPLAGAAAAGLCDCATCIASGPELCNGSVHHFIIDINTFQQKLLT